MQRHLLVYTEAAAHAPTEGGWDVSKRFASFDSMYTTCGDRWDAIDRKSGEVFRKFLRRFRPRAFSIERRLEFTPREHDGNPDMDLVGAIYLTYRKQSHHAPPQLLGRSTPMSLVFRGRSNYRFASSRYRNTVTQFAVEIKEAAAQNCPCDCIGRDTILAHRA